MSKVPFFISALVLSPLVFSACDAGQKNDPHAQLTQAITISMNEVLQYARNAGLPCDSLVIAGAIAAAESSLDTDGFGATPPTYQCPSGSFNRGLWQLSDCHNPEVSDACAFDPACSSRVMVRLSWGGANWTPWAAYNDGSYGLWLDIAQAAYFADQDMLGCR